MTNDSALFPPRPKWEERGYRPDEYSRWIRGDWRPVAELWAELKPPSTAPLRRGPGDDAPFHNAPPYESLPVSRADLPPGVILSRDMTAFIREEEVCWEMETVKDDNGNDVEVRYSAVALPLYEGRMIGQFDFSEKGWVSGKGRSAVWHEIRWSQKHIEPQYLMLKAHVLGSGIGYAGPKIAYMRIASATNSRTMTSTFLDGPPAGDSVFFFRSTTASPIDCALIVGAFGTFSYDFQVRNRLGGLNMSEFVIVETAVPAMRRSEQLTAAVVGAVQRLSINDKTFAPSLLQIAAALPRQGAEIGTVSEWALTPHERLRVRCILDAAVAAFYGLNLDDLKWILKDCDHPVAEVTNKAFARKLDPKGFWRVDKAEPPERRHTVLTLAAFADLQTLIAAGVPRDDAIAAFCGQRHPDQPPLPQVESLIGSIEPDGWMLADHFRLADLGLGHDDRAQHPQPVAPALGPRFYDWQLAQDPAESWRECELHARNLLGAEGFERLKAELEGRAIDPANAEGTRSGQGEAKHTGRDKQQGGLFD